MILPLLLLNFLQVPEVKSKGAELYADCKTFVAVADTHSGVRAPLEWLRAGRCMGYVEAMGQATAEMKISCPANATLLTTVRVYVAFMDKNPKYLDLSNERGLIDSLIDAYPCPKK